MEVRGDGDSRSACAILALAASASAMAAASSSSSVSAALLAALPAARFFFPFGMESRDFAFSQQVATTAPCDMNSGVAAQYTTNCTVFFTSDEVWPTHFSQRAAGAAPHYGPDHTTTY